MAIACFQGAIAFLLVALQKFERSKNVSAFGQFGNVFVERAILTNLEVS
jgi:hypothetical protein